MAEILPFLESFTEVNIIYIILIIFFSAAFIQIFYYLFFYFRVSFDKKKTTEPQKLIPLSVVICARNEARNLRRYLQSILEQDYPEYEVIVVNDCSEDDTEIVLKGFSQQYEHLRTTFLREDPKFPHGKKLALTVGIKAAQYDYVVLTDADCYPVSKKWLQNIASRLTEEKSIVLGYGGYIERKGFLNRMIRYDTLWIALQYFSFAKAGIPYMGVGRNLAYKKSLFFENKGFASHASLESGDDDLFINQVGKGGNTSVMFDHESHTRSRPKIRFKNWIEQKRRHLTTSSRYKKGHRFLLVLEPTSRLLFYFLSIPLLIFDQYRLIVIGVIALRMILFSINIIGCKKRFNERKMFFVAFILDFFLLFFYFYCMMLNIFSPYKRWR